MHDKGDLWTCDDSFLYFGLATIERITHVLFFQSKVRFIVKNQKITYFVPPRDRFNISSTDIITNPELGLKINDVPHVIKLFFSKDKLLKVKANFMIAIMDSLWPDKTNAVLDVRNAKLFTFTGNRDHYLNAIKAEVASIEVMWPDL